MIPFLTNFERLEAEIERPMKEKGPLIWDQRAWQVFAVWIGNYLDATLLSLSNFR